MKPSEMLRIRLLNQMLAGTRPIAVGDVARGEFSPHRVFNLGGGR